MVVKRQQRDYGHVSHPLRIASRPCLSATRLSVSGTWKASKLVVIVSYRSAQKNDKRDSEETLKKSTEHTNSGYQRLSCSCLLVVWSHPGRHERTAVYPGIFCCFVHGRLQDVLLWVRHVDTAAIRAWFVPSCRLRAKGAQTQKPNKRENGPRPMTMKSR